jgi:hypothetical protein
MIGRIKNQWIANVNLIKMKQPFIKIASLKA